MNGIFFCRKNLLSIAISAEVSKPVLSEIAASHTCFERTMISISNKIEMEMYERRLENLKAPRGESCGD